MGQAGTLDAIPHSQHLLLETFYSRQLFQNFTKRGKRNNPSKEKDNMQYLQK